MVARVAGASLCVEPRVVMSDVDCAVGATPCLTAKDHHGFEIDEAEVIYCGRCPACRGA